MSTLGGGCKVEFASLKASNPFDVLLFQLDRGFSLAPPFPFLLFSPTFLCHLQRPPMLSTLLLVALLATLCVAGNSQHSFSPGFPYGSQPVRGVNLGGWLVLEVCYCPSAPLLLPCFLVPLTAATQPWITPSLFDDTGNPAIVDEWTFTQLQEHNVARAKLVKHWDTWITEADFQSIAGAGCVLVIRCISRH